MNMRLRDSLRTAIHGLEHARTRSLLTMLGIIIGIGSVIILMSIGTSAQDLILNQVQSLGSDLVFIVPGSSKGSRFGTPESVLGAVIKTLTTRDTDAFKKEPSIYRVAPEVRGSARIVYENNDTSITFEGITADFFSVRNLTFARGYPFTDSDVDSFNKVAVLGNALATTLFGETDPIGKTVRLHDASFRVVGVLDKKGIGPMGVDQDNTALIPLSVAQKQLLGINYLNFVSLQASKDYTPEFAKSRIISVLRQNHGITDPDKDDFTVRTQEDSLSILGNITGILKAFLASIAAISLVVGGIGIMNIMFVSVVERTREIGLRKAVGATNGDILTQFLTEAVMITFIGGVIGILFGGSFSYLAYLILSNTVAAGWTFSLPISSVILAVGVSTATGLIFGIYPARKAAEKNPIEALRYE